MEFLLFLVVLCVMFLTARCVSVLIHELGHALPAMILTRQKVTIYIGSYGEQERSLRFRIGLLHVNIKYNPLSWDLGLCVPSAKDIPVAHQIFYIAAGPIATLLMAIAGVYFAFHYDLDDSLKLFAFFLIMSAIYDLFNNLNPISTPIRLTDGKITYRDGYQIKRLYMFRRVYPLYADAVELYNNKKYTDALPKFQQLIDKGFDEDTVFRCAISSCVQSGDFQNAKRISVQFIKIGDLNSDDYSLFALIYSQLDEHERALEYYDQALIVNPDNHVALHNKAYTLSLVNRFGEAIPLFDKTVIRDDKSAYAYNNRGLCKIKIGQIEEGLRDIRHGLNLDSSNSYGYRNLGIYHFEQGEYSEALQLFRKAKDLDPNTHRINQLISDAERSLADAKSWNVQ